MGYERFDCIDQGLQSETFKFVGILMPFLSNPVASLRRISCFFTITVTIATALKRVLERTTVTFVLFTYRILETR